MFPKLGLINVNSPIVSSSCPITLIGGVNPAPGTLSEALSIAPNVVAADGGADHALAAGLTPEAVVGDMDSISEAARAAFKGVLHPIAEQNSTDFDKALRHTDAPLVLGVGFSGARLDHELGAMTVLVRHPERRCILIGEETIVLLCPPQITLDLPLGSAVSLFPMAEVGCESDGLRWPTGGLRFSPDAQIGTLNKVDGVVALRPDAAKMLLILPRAALGVTVQALLKNGEKWPVRAE